MRNILIKLERRQLLAGDEYSQLMNYVDELRMKSPESFLLFYNKYASILYQDYQTYIPRFTHGLDDFYDYLVNNSQLTERMRNHDLSVEAFPQELRSYLLFTYGETIKSTSLTPLINLIKGANEERLVLPQPRSKEVVIKYEKANPYKEAGLKAHFDRISRYSFVSRLQSYRYLRNNKASIDRIDVVSGDSLGGIFTNKEKSIYYYIFLTERNMLKAANACRVLNLAIYDRSTGEISDADDH